MDYAASLINIEILKNHIRPYNCKHIHFDFYTSTEFKTQIFSEIDSEFIESAIQICQEKNKPYARILIEENGLEILYYFDEKFLFEFDLMQDRIVRFHSSSCLEHKSSNIKLQMLQLIRQLKNLR